MASKFDDMGATEDTAVKVARYWKFWFLVIGILFFFGLHNYMQELIMSLPGFKVGVIQSFLYFAQLTFVICTYADWHFSGIFRSSGNGNRFLF